MAISLTLDQDKTSHLGNHILTGGTGNLGTYAADGIAVTANACGLGVLLDLQVMPAAGYVFEFDATNSKVKAFEAGADGGALDEVGVTDISAAIFQWQALGF